MIKYDLTIDMGNQSQITRLHYGGNGEAPVCYSLFYLFIFSVIIHWKFLIGNKNYFKFWW